MDKTIIYISSNRENSKFEEKLRKTLLENSQGLPIVSVTQKPVDLGINICVGDVGASGFNFCRQLQIACEVATTPYVVSAESDALYPPDYFLFTPERLDIPYRNRNTFVQRHGQDYVFKKGSVTSSQVTGRKFYIDRLRELFDGQPEWNTEMKNFPKEIKKPLFEEFEYFTSENPTMSFKTGQGMRRWSTPESMKKYYELPYWGSIKDLRKFYGDN